ncbi:translation initiation factor IF-5A [Candidatus Woesearchaeota archaeon]|nr:translation initiation factor IF-5A [Candidatus Woesearchaeota archaeon]MBI2661629.1 translation initiation factor IF-5A [Candidatus Woesearchaeota archaeon]
MAIKVVGAGGVQKGSFIIMEGVASKVVDTVTSKTGKHGHAKIRITAIGLVDDKKRVIVLPAHDNVEVPIIEKKTAQVLSIHGDMANVMDAETYETFDIKIADELKGQVTEGMQVLYWIIMNEKVMKQIKGGE